MPFEWFSEFRAIPGVAWEPLVPLDRSKLQGHDARPRVSRFDRYDGSSRDLVEWELPDGSSLSDEFSTSPASQHSSKLDARRAPAARALALAKNASESLALPGSREDYHFAIIGACSAMYSVRGTEPLVFDWIEQLCLADISLFEQGAQLVFADERLGRVSDREYSVATPSFDQLSRLYLREGFIAAAAEVENRFARLTGSRRPTGDDVVERQRALMEEDGR
jgi:hypothetical protein